MNGRDAIRLGIKQADMVVRMYLADLSDSDLLVRPVPGANHIAWQLGHLLSSSHQMLEVVAPSACTPLPAGFAEKYTGQGSKFDSPGAFHPKSVYMELYDRHVAATMRALDTVTDADLDKPSPESMQSYAPTHGDLLTLQGSHWMMHAGQWAIVRRKLGKKPLF